MHCRKAWLARALGLLVLGAVPMASHAGVGALRCDPAPGWNDFSLIETSMQGDVADGRPPMSMTLRTAVYDDGVRVTAEGDQPRADMIQLTRASPAAVLASAADVPLQLGEAGMLYEGPIEALRRQGAGPCELREKTRYPVDFSVRGAAVTGQVERDGDTVRIAIHYTRQPGALSMTGRLVYASPRGSIPADIAIHGWTIFRGPWRPDAGELSRFTTLGDFLNTLAAPAPGAK